MTGDAASREMVQPLRRGVAVDFDGFARLGKGWFRQSTGPVGPAPKDGGGGTEKT